MMLTCDRCSWTGMNPRVDVKSGVYVARCPQCRAFIKNLPPDEGEAIIGERRAGMQGERQRQRAYLVGRVLPAVYTEADCAETLDAIADKAIAAADAVMARLYPAKEGVQP